MQIQMRAYVLNFRFDVMEEDGKQPFPWANLHYAGEPRVTDNFAGADLAKMRVTSQEENRIAKKLHSLYGESLPALCDITCQVEIRGGKTELTCIDMSLAT